MPLNVDQALMDAVKAAIVARVPVSSADPIPTLAVRSYRWRSDPGTPTMNASTNGNAGAYPYLAGDITSSNFRRRPATFGDLLGPNDLRMGEPGTVGLRLLIVFETPLEQDQTALEAEVLASLYALGPKLGIPWVGGVTPRVTRENKSGPETGNSRRMVVTINLAIDVRPGNHLLAS